MKAIRLHEFGGAEQLRLEEIEQPQPRADEVFIKNAAAAINYADIMLRSGTYLGDQQLPTIPGFEAAAIARAARANVTDWQVGQRVLALVREGGYAEYVVAHVSQLVPIPDDLAFGQATALLVQGLTAIALLRDLQAGQTILVHTAAGGVGSLLVQLAKYKGAKVIGTASILESGYEHPHGYLHLEVPGKTWLVVLAPPSRMENRGLPRTMLQARTVASVQGYPHRNDPNEMRAERITIDGKTVELR